MNLRAEIRSFLDAHEGREPEELAAMFVRGCDKDDLLPLVVEAFKWQVRDMVRLAEVEALDALAPVRQLPSVTATALGELADLLDQPYRIGDGQPRRFGAMTTAEHETRVAMLAGQISGLQRDVELHRRAIAAIEESGATCLDDVASRIAKAAA